MKANLENIFKTLENQFDLEAPPIGHFERFEAKLHKKNPGKSIFTIITTIAVAASIVLFVGIWLGKEFSNKGMQLASVSTEMEETQSYFVSMIEKELNVVKKERNIAILAHNYQTPEIFHCVADVVGDSLKLAYASKEVDAETIILAGVHFMAESAKLISPEKKILIPDMRAGCSLAESITAADIRLLKQKYPGVPVVTYVNTSAEVKSETDVCC